MKMRQALDLVGGFTADQWGMVTSRQAKGLGVDDSTLHRMEKVGYLDRVRRGVYASTTAVVTAAREEQAAWLALNPGVASWDRQVPDPDGGVLSHQSATRLHGLGELVNDRITFTTPRRRTSRDPDLWFKLAKLDGDDVMFVDGLPVTTALRTICDLLDQHIDGSHIATIIRDAVLANLVRLDALAEHIGPYALRYGVRRPGDGEALLGHLLAQIGTSARQLAYRPITSGSAGWDVATATWGDLAQNKRFMNTLKDVNPAGSSLVEAFVGNQRHIGDVFGVANPLAGYFRGHEDLFGVSGHKGAGQAIAEALAAGSAGAVGKMLFETAAARGFAQGVTAVAEALSRDVAAAEHRAVDDDGGHASAQTSDVAHELPRITDRPRQGHGEEDRQEH